MTIRLNTNIAALTAHKSLTRNDEAMTQSLNRLSSGLRINTSADDASGLSIADSLYAQSESIDQAIQNAHDGASLVQTADGALQEYVNILNTIKAKAVQAASDGQTSTTRQAIQNDVNKLLEELNTIATTTSFNGQKLLSGAYTDKAIQTGAYAGENTSISIDSTKTADVGNIAQADLTLKNNDGGAVQLTITSAITGEKLTLSNVDIQYNNTPENGMGALADELNRYTSLTGISAIAVVETTTERAISQGATGSDFAINGVPIGAIVVEDNDTSGTLIGAINDKTPQTGVSAALNPDGSLTLTTTDHRAIQVTGGVKDVLGNTANQMSTIGYIELTQTGDGDFEIEGIGATPVGADIGIARAMSTVEDSILASGSTIAFGSKLAAGTVLGGDALVETTVPSTSLAYELKTASTLYPTTKLAAGTVLGGAVTVSGDTVASPATGTTALDQDMLVSAGSTLKAYSTLGAGTVVTTAFTTTASGAAILYNVGDTLTNAVMLTQDLPLTSDMTLSHDIGAQNSSIKAGSTLAADSTLGAEFSIGVTTTSVGTSAVAAGGTAATDILTTADLTTNATTSFTIPAGSMLSSGSNVVLVSGTPGTDVTWSGQTLVTTSGVIQAGDTVSAGVAYTLTGDQVLSTDLTTGTGGASLITAGSILKAGFINGSNVLAAGDTQVATLSDAVLTQNMVVENNSSIAAGSKLMTGSTLGDYTYVMGGDLNADTEDLKTYASTSLAEGSTLEKGSILAHKSTIGGTATLASDTPLDSDMNISMDSTLTRGTLLAAGTIIPQDMTLSTDPAGKVLVEVGAGTAIASDLYLTQDTNLTQDMTVLQNSILAAGTTLATNITNTSTMMLSQTENYTLANIDLTTSESAQRGISIVDSAIQEVDAILASLGAVQNQLSSSIANLTVTQTNLQSSESTIREIDFSEETMIYSRLQALSQTGTYSLAQANATAKDVLSLLE